MLLSPQFEGRNDEPMQSSLDRHQTMVPRSTEGDTFTDGSTVTLLSPLLVGLQEDPIQSSSD